MTLIRRDAWQRTPHISPPSLSHFPFLVSMSRCCLRPLLIFESHTVFTPPPVVGYQYRFQFLQPLPSLQFPDIFSPPAPNQLRPPQSRRHVGVLAGRRFSSSPCGSCAEREEGILARSSWGSASSRHQRQKASPRPPPPAAALSPPSRSKRARARRSSVSLFSTPHPRQPLPPLVAISPDPIPPATQ